MQVLYGQRVSLAFKGRNAEIHSTLIEGPELFAVLADTKGRGFHHLRF